MSESLSCAAFPLDRDAADRMWADYRAAHPAAAAAGPDYTVEHFGDSPRLADQLLDAVLNGPKRATSELVAEFFEHGDQLPRIGSHWIACDGTGAPRIIIRSTELRVGPFASADAAFAFDEGEDDRSLESWQREHRRYFTRVAAARGADWSEDDEIVFERFAVVWPPEHAD
ncbi:ASCH domain-containing protein [Microbacterium sp. KSW4-11]|uniref:ASCH domain-containing protein n=1 Tax=Microbacterium gawkjiense TaxID=3067309 RepID=A0ABU3G922_9MICO|nr:ASCH domain-containing protein [Microbacterium sp. KSW4-11]MDT3316308.1 ASCH domain-containing protein [Microbacterium sp. KSW4-11]